MRENFTIEDKETGKIYWISRALAVTGVIITLDETGESRILLERRGSGCPDNVGKLCCVCGYLNWDETRREALVREVYEETGLDISGLDLQELETIDDPSKDSKQNVVTRYAVYYPDLEKELKNGTINTDTESRGGEANEVSEFLLLSYSEIVDLDPSEFAFGHKDLIIEVLNEQTLI